jgi:N-acetylglucosaminyldiphosphoundecaprenol N-acetyl-beta-D-mannosaminyltransferase
MTSAATRSSISFGDGTPVHPDISVQTIGGLPIAVINRARSARLMIDMVTVPRPANRLPLVFTSANGQVLSMRARDPEVRQLFEAADLIHAEGLPLVFASQFLCQTPLPERVATTDLFHDVAGRAQRAGTTFYFLGATDGTLRRAVRQSRLLYPRLRIVGYRDGRFSAAEEPAVVDAINAARPDILWIDMDTPRELAFAVRNRHRLSGIGIIKTAGGLFDFLSGRTRAPHWVQAAGLERAFRMMLAPRRLAGRFLLTNPHALFLLLTQAVYARPGPGRGSRTWWRSAAPNSRITPGGSFSPAGSRELRLTIQHTGRIHPRVVDLSATRLVYAVGSNNFHWGTGTVACRRSAQAFPNARPTCFRIRKALLRASR